MQKTLIILKSLQKRVKKIMQVTLSLMNHAELSAIARKPKMVAMTISRLMGLDHTFKSNRQLNPIALKNLSSLQTNLDTLITSKL